MHLAYAVSPVSAVYSQQTQWLLVYSQQAVGCTQQTLCLLRRLSYTKIQAHHFIWNPEISYLDHGTGPRFRSDSRSRGLTVKSMLVLWDLWAAIIYRLHASNTFPFYLPYHPSFGWLLHCWYLSSSEKLRVDPLLIGGLSTPAPD